MKQQKVTTVSYLRSGLPWITFAVLSAVNWKAACITAFFVALAVLVHERRTGATWDALILQTGAVVFFLIASLLALAAPHSPLAPYTGAGAQLWLGLIAWGSLAARMPFTYGIAKHGVPAAVAQSPTFLRVNMTITTFWAASFTVTGLLIVAVYHATANSGAAGLVQIISLLVPVVFTLTYKKHAHARAVAMQAAHEAAQTV